MTICILPARLANQIAAGEVVERPASVVKELVENSLDSGATRIDIDIEKGGAKLIRVRDNGSGIVKDELGLALSRHATSKIRTLDDLEAIISLGFRGEALASISSVSRLTLTSRPESQDQAWSAYSEGRDMAVKLQPSAHPVGTTVEVLDLFFNTPARRKFLRTEKTEFTHIDELLKRIALSRFDVTFTLRHNGKVVRQYRAAHNPQQEEKRLAAVCGSQFVNHMLKIELEHQGLQLRGWITTPQGARQQSDLQYCYVNGRMMRDKLINHAIRQSYESSLRSEQFATYVLFIEIEPNEVDVNVHPAKHEVRFHQARLVHDFIYQALSGALAESECIPAPELNSSAFSHVAETPMRPASHTATQLPSSPSTLQEPKATLDGYRGGELAEPSTRSSPSWSRSSGGKVQPETHEKQAITEQHRHAYQQLMQTQHPSTTSTVVKAIQPNPSMETLPNKLGKAIAVIEGRYLLTTSDQGCVLLALTKAYEWKLRGQFDTQAGPLKSQPLLVPLSLRVAEEELAVIARFRDILITLGIDLVIRGQQSVMVMGVPQPLRQQNLQHLIPDLLSYLMQLAQDSSQSQYMENLVNWLCSRVLYDKSDYTLSEAIQLVAELEQIWHNKLPLHDNKLIQPVDFSTTIAAFN